MSDLAAALLAAGAMILGFAVAIAGLLVYLSRRSALPAARTLRVPQPGVTEPPPDYVTRGLAEIDRRAETHLAQVIRAGSSSASEADARREARRMIAQAEGLPLPD